MEAQPRSQSPGNEVARLREVGAGKFVAKFPNFFNKGDIEPAARLTRVRVLGADQKKSGFWGRDCNQGNEYHRYAIRNNDALSDCFCNCF